MTHASDLVQDHSLNNSQEATMTLEQELTLLMKEAAEHEARDANFARFEAQRDRRNAIQRTHIRRMCKADNKFAASLRADNWGALRGVKFPSA